MLSANQALARLRNSARLSGLGSHRRSRISLCVIADGLPPHCPIRALSLCWATVQHRLATVQADAFKTRSALPRRE